MKEYLAQPMGTFALLFVGCGSNDRIYQSCSETRKSSAIVHSVQANKQELGLLPREGAMS
jgi:hypothetical protein